jgi:hypothetical protein
LYFFSRYIFLLHVRVGREAKIAVAGGGAFVVFNITLNKNIDNA